MAGSGTAHLRPAEETLLRVENLLVEFPVGRTGLKVNAVTNISLDVKPGERNAGHDNPILDKLHNVAVSHGKSDLYALVDREL